MDKFYKAIFIGFLLAASILLIYPQIDIQVAQLFYRPDAGFYLNQVAIIQFVYKAIPIFVYIFFAGFIFLFIGHNFLKYNPLKIGNRELIYLLAVLLIGPGLIVNMFFKDHFGRARPYQVVDFGGTKNFSRPLVIANQCIKNCSFPSGHAATGFYLIAIALLCQRRKKLMVSMAILFGFLVGLGRMMQGGHFLSDIVFSGLIVFTVSYTFYYLMILPSIETKL